MHKQPLLYLRGLPCGLALLAYAAPSSLGAQVTGEAVEGGSPASVNLVVTIRASVAAACGFAPDALPSGTVNLGAIDQAFSAEVPFALRCNGPMRVAIVSSNGGLRAGDVPTAPSGYTNLAPYEVTLNLAGNAGVASAQDSCSSLDLLAGAAACGFRGPATAASGLLLPGPSSDAGGSFVRVSSAGFSGPKILVASDQYVDRLTVTFSPAT